MNDKLSSVARWAVLALLGCVVGVTRAGEWTIETVEDGYGFGGYTSVALLPSGYPVISYWDNIDGDLEYAWLDPGDPNDPNDDVWRTRTVDAAGQVGEYNRLVVLPSGQPAVAYYDRTNQRIMYAWLDPNSDVWQKSVVDNAVVVTNVMLSMTLTAAGTPAVCYCSGVDFQAVLMYAWLDQNGVWQPVVVDNSGDVGGYSSVATFPLDHPNVALRGQPAAAYFDWGAGHLKFAWCAGDPADPGAWQGTVVAAGGWVGSGTSLVIYPGDHPQWPGQPAIAYRDQTNEDLMFARHTGDDLATGWQSMLVDAQTGCAYGASLALLSAGRETYSFDGTRTDLSGQPVISYVGDGGLRLAWLDKSDLWNSVAIASCVAWWAQTSLSVPATGPWAAEPVISFFCYSDLYFTRHDAFGWFTTVVQPAQVLNEVYNDVVLQTTGPYAGQPAVTYNITHPLGRLKVAERDASGTWHKSDVVASPGWCMSMGIQQNGPDAGQPAVVSEWYGLHYRERRSNGDWEETWFDNGWYMRLAFQCSGDPALSYDFYDDLKYAERGPDGQWVTRIVDSDGNVGYWTSLAFFPPDHPAYPCQPAISYYKDWPEYVLKFAWRDTNGEWHTTTVDSTVVTGLCTTLVIFPMSHPTHPGQPAISYEDYTNNGLRFAWHAGADFDFAAPSSWAAVRVDDGGHGSSMALLPSGQPAIVHDAWGPKYTVHRGADFSDPQSWTTISLDPQTPGGNWMRIAVTPAGRPVISYNDPAHWDMKVAIGTAVGDLNCDGTRDFADINPFVLALTNPAGYTAEFPDCNVMLADIDGDGTVGFGDINPFVALLTGK